MIIKNVFFLKFFKEKEKLVNFKKELSEAIYWTVNGGDKESGRITKALSQEIVTALFDENGIIANFLFAFSRKVAILTVPKAPSPICFSNL